MDKNEKDNVLHMAQLLEYLSFLKHHPPNISKSISHFIGINQICYNAFNDVMKEIFGPLPEFKGVDGEVEEVFGQ